MIIIFVLNNNKAKIVKSFIVKTFVLCRTNFWCSKSCNHKWWNVVPTFEAVVQTEKLQNVRTRFYHPYDCCYCTPRVSSTQQRIFTKHFFFFNIARILLWNIFIRQRIMEVLTTWTFKILHYFPIQYFLVPNYYFFFFCARWLKYVERKKHKLPFEKRKKKLRPVEILPIWYSSFINNHLHHISDSTIELIKCLPHWYKNMIMT